MVNISTVFYSMQVEVTPGNPYTLTLNHTFITTDGHERKGVILVSETELMVVVYKMDLATPDMYIGATQIYDLKTAGFEYYILSDTKGCSSSSLVNSFFSIAGHWDSTFVEMYNDKQEFVEAVVVSRYECYTKRSTESTTDFTGYYFRTRFPVTVIAGSMCVDNGNAYSTGSYFSSVPPIIHYGLEFTTPNMDEPVSGGPAITILASQPYTLVTYEQESVVLSTGAFVSYEFNYTDVSIVVKCSMPCFMIQSTVSQMERTVGDTMFNIIPTEQFYSEAYFSTSSIKKQHYLSIMVLGLPPMEDILLDGAPMESVTWRYRGRYTYVDIAVSEGQHYVESTGSKTFSAYVYCYTGVRGGGFGYAIWPQGR